MAVIKSPTQIREEQAQGLISLLNDIKAKIDENRDDLKNCVLRLNGVLERYYMSTDTYMVAAIKLKTNILVLVNKNCDMVKAIGRCNVQDIANDTNQLIDSVVEEVKALGLPERKTALDKSVNVNTTVSQNQEQHQNQKQDVIVKILLEAVKDELTGKQWKELLVLAKDKEDPEKTRKSILDKIKGFGENVAANIVANIFTNPEVWQCLGSML